MAETGIKGGVELIVHIAKETAWIIERHTTGGKLKLAQKSMDRIQELFEMHSTILTQPEKKNIERWINASASPPLLPLINARVLRRSLLGLCLIKTGYGCRMDGVSA
jgi:hypothetical protein